MGLREKTLYGLHDVISHLVEARAWGILWHRLTTLRFLEAKAEAGLVFDLAEDFTRALRGLPKRHPNRRILALLEEALRRDIHFIARHPSTLFQCLWNSCWWYDCREAERHYVLQNNGSREARSAWRKRGPKVSALVQRWRYEKAKVIPGHLWIRSLRPPAVPLGSQQECVLVGHEGRVHAVQFFSKGQRLMSGGEDGRIRLWDTLSGVEIAERRFSSPVRALAALGDGKRAGVGLLNGEVFVYDVAPGSTPVLIGNHKSCIISIIPSRDGRTLVAGSRDGEVCVWDIPARRRIRRIGRSGKIANAVGASRDGKLVAIARDGGVVEIHLLPEGRKIQQFRHHAMGVYGVSFAPDSETVVSCGVDGLMVWNALTGKKHCYCSKHDGLVLAASISPDGRRLVSCGTDGTVRLWALPEGQEEACLRGHNRSVVCVAFSSDGRLVASASEDGKIRIWDPERPSPPRPRPGDQEMVMTAHFSPNGRYVVSDSDVWRLWVWDSGTGEMVSGLHREKASPFVSMFEDKVLCSAWSRDGSLLAAGYSNGAVLVWEPSSGKVSGLLGHTFGVRQVAFGCTKDRLVSAGHDGTVRVWATDTQHELVCMALDEAPRVPALTVSHSGRLAAAMGREGEMMTFRTRDGRLVDSVSCRASIVYEITFSPTERFLAYERDEGGLGVHDIDARRQVLRFPRFCQGLECVAFSSDDKWCALAGGSGKVRIVSLGSGHGFSLPGTLRGAHKIAFSERDARILFGLGPRGRLAAWDVVSGKALSDGEALRSLRRSEGQFRRFFLRVFDGPGGLAVYRLGDQEAACRWPGPCWIVSADPAGGTWAVAENSRLQLLTIEGTPELVAQEPVRGRAPGTAAR